MPRKLKPTQIESTEVLRAALLTLPEAHRGQALADVVTAAGYVAVPQRLLDEQLGHKSTLAHVRLQFGRIYGRNHDLATALGYLLELQQGKTQHAQFCTPEEPAARCEACATLRLVEDALAKHAEDQSDAVIQTELGKC